MSKLAPSLTKMTDSVSSIAHETDKAFKQVPAEVVALETQAMGSEAAVLVKGFSGVEAAALEAYSKRLESVEERLDAMESAILMRSGHLSTAPSTAASNAITNSPVEEDLWNFVRSKAFK